MKADETKAWGREVELRGTLVGRKAEPLHAEVVRELTLADLALRETAESLSTGQARPLVKLKYQHHRLAQLLAAGLAEADASIITGYSLSRISILRGDPAFAQLISHYESQSREIYADLQGRMAGFALNTLDELQERLEESPNLFTNKELATILQMANDRGGNSPIQRSQTQTVVLTADDLATIRKEVKDKENGRIIEAASAIENNSGPAGRKASDGCAPTLVKGETAQGRKGEGEDV